MSSNETTTRKSVYVSSAANRCIVSFSDPLPLRMEPWWSLRRRVCVGGGGGTWHNFTIITNIGMALEGGPGHVPLVPPASVTYVEGSGMATGMKITI